MSLRKLTVLISRDEDTVFKILADDPDVIDTWSEGSNEAEAKVVCALVPANSLQRLIDRLQEHFTTSESWRIIITPVETTIPRQEEPEPEPEESLIYGGLTREELYDRIIAGATTNSDFVLLVFLATIVSAIGLVTDNLAVIIGAMVIAPLLGPNLALSFGVALGDKQMVLESLKSNAVGFGLTMGISILAGLFIPFDSFSASEEYLQRTNVGFDGALLALASGAAAVLSLTAGISNTMVGVMVAVALMPPAVVMGLSIGSGALAEAYGAALLLAINIICVNLTAKLVFTIKGIRPLTWYKQKQTKQSLRISLLFWIGALIILLFLVYLHSAEIMYMVN